MLRAHPFSAYDYGALLSLVPYQGRNVVTYKEFQRLSGGRVDSLWLINEARGLSSVVDLMVLECEN